MTILEFCEWLETTPMAAFARTSLYGFQILVAIHILGVMLSVGTLLWVDLRMLGLVMPKISVAAAYRALVPWFLCGFAIMLGSGFMLFAGFATSAYGNAWFRLKLVAIALAGLNAVVYHVAIERPVPVHEHSQAPPTPVRVSGLVSILLWFSVVFAGRMISYTLF